MAKSEAVAEQYEDETFDQEDILEDDLDNIPEEQQLRGVWTLEWVSAKVKQGHGEKGPWTMINITLEPVSPAGEDADERAAEYDLDDLPRVYHRMFYNMPRDKRAFAALTKAFGVETGKLRERLQALRGRYAIAKATMGNDNFGRPEVKLSGFRPAA